MLNIQENRFGGPVCHLVITIDTGEVIEVWADTVSLGHGETSSQLSWSLSDPNAKV